MSIARLFSHFLFYFLIRDLLLHRGVMKPLSSVRKGPHTWRHNTCLPGETDKRGKSEQMSPTVLSKRFGGQEKQRRGKVCGGEGE